METDSQRDDWLWLTEVYMANGRYSSVCVCVCVSVCVYVSVCLCMAAKKLKRTTTGSQRKKTLKKFGNQFVSILVKAAHGVGQN